MKKIILAFIALTFVTACQQNTQTAKDTLSDYKPKTESERLSYSMGNQFGKELANDQRAYDMDAMLAGIKAAWSKSETSLTEEEMTMIIKEQMKKEREEKVKARDERWEARNKLGEFYQLHSKQYLENHAKEEGVKITDSGLHYKHIVVGQGKSPKMGDQVEIQIKGNFIDGKEFENTYTRQPVHVKIGANSKGLDEALMMMKAGGKSEFVIPEELGYGAEGAGLTIPPHAILIYEIELLKVL